MTLEERKRKMREAGIPIPQQLINEGSIAAIPVTSQNADKHAKLQALKSGANKQQVQQLVKSSSVQNGFQGIPEPKIKKAPNQASQIEPDKRVAVESFSSNTPISSEAKALEAMYGGGNDFGHQPSLQMGSADSVQQDFETTQPELTINQDGYGPSFDPQTAMANRRGQMQKENQYMKYAVQPEQQAMAMSENASQPTAQGQQSFNFEYMQKMMQEIAKNTISEVLNNYTEKQKSKLTYENYTKTQDGHQVIKTSDGKLFKLVPVKIKQG